MTFKTSKCPVPDLSSQILLITELVMCGVAYHHAGLDSSDRKSIEAMFTNGDLPVLCMKVILIFSSKYSLFQYLKRFILIG